MAMASDIKELQRVGDDPAGAPRLPGDAARDAISHDMVDVNGADGDESPDKVGEALREQRFQMLTDIARDLAGDVVFPTCFDAALRLRQELQNPDVPVARLVKVIGVEPLIATKLLRMANSAYYNPSGEQVLGLSPAIQRLGLQLVRTTALAVAVNQLMRSRDMAVFADLTRDIWLHSVRTAAAARVLASARTRINPEEAMLAGLVHDLGAFYMLYRATQYSELRARPESMKYLIVHWHESIGVALLNALGLSDEIVEATVDHDQPRPAPSNVRTLSDIVYVANVLAGAHFEWLYQDFDPQLGQAGEVRQNFADLLDAIEAEAQDMLAVFA